MGTILRKYATDATYTMGISVFRKGSSFRPIPQLGVRFLVDSNSWNVNEKPQNCEADAKEH